MGVRCTLRRQPSGLRLPLSLALPSSPGVVDLHRNRERLGSAAIARAAHRSCAEIIEAHRDAGMGVSCANAVGGIEGHPAELWHEGFRPGVPSLLMHHAIL